MASSADPTAAPMVRTTKLVPPALAEQRVDQVLAALVDGLTRSQAQRLIREGHVTIDGRPANKAGEPVAAAATLVIDQPAPVPSTLQAQALPLPILYEDADIVVIDKPAGLVVHPGAGHGDGTLVNALLHHVEGLSGIGGEQRPGIVHRLDKGTSGVMVVAKHDRAHQSLARQFSDRQVEKEYLALVWGALEARRSIESAIGRDPHDRQRMSVRARHGRDAITVVVHAEPLRGVTLVRVSIATGRTHQIRVHLQSIGHPVVGDATYGGLRKPLPLDLRVLATLDRPFLHAARLVLQHPTDGRRLTFEAAIPADLSRVLDVLRQNRATRSA